MGQACLAVVTLEQGNPSVVCLPLPKIKLASSTFLFCRQCAADKQTEYWCLRVCQNSGEDIAIEDMLRALELPTLKSHNLCYRGRRCCGLASLVTSTVKPPKSRSFSTLVVFLRKASEPVSPSLVSGRWRTLMLPNLRSPGAVSFSAGFTGEAEREILVQHLLVSEDQSKLLLELQRMISEGTDLSDLAVEYSICPSKDNGGMLGWVRKGQMVPEFEEAAFATPLNKVVRCKTKFGWHLLQVLSEREACMLQDIEPEELRSKMQNPGFLEEAQLIDVREPEEVAQASLPGFKVLPLRQFGSWGPGIANELNPDKDTYVLCHHGVRSLQVAKWLQTQGFRKVSNISGGIHSYALKADPSIPTY